MKWMLWKKTFPSDFIADRRNIWDNRNSSVWILILNLHTEHNGKSAISAQEISSLMRNKAALMTEHSDDQMISHSRGGKTSVYTNPFRLQISMVIFLSSSSVPFPTLNLFPQLFHSPFPYISMPGSLFVLDCIFRLALPLVCALPFIYLFIFCSECDIICPTCLLSDSVCSTRCLSDCLSRCLESATTCLLFLVSFLLFSEDVRLHMQRWNQRTDPHVHLLVFSRALWAAYVSKYKTQTHGCCAERGQNESISCAI